MKRIFVMFLLALPAGGARSQTMAEILRDRLSDRYTAGSALIYDCADGHWVCVAEADHAGCGKTRARDQALGKIRLGCLPGPVDASREDCRARLPGLAGRAGEPRGCLHPAHRGRLIGFQ